MSTRPRHHVAAALAVGLFATAAGSAQAATYEQLSRDSGRAGQSSLAPSIPVFASDTGLGGGFARYDDLSTFPPVVNTFARVSALNATAPIRSAGAQLLAIDRTETIGLFATINAATSSYDLTVGPLYGKGTARPVGSISGVSLASAALSGDGRTAVLSDANGTRAVTVATGAVKPLTSDYVALASSSVSDDGSVVAGGLQSDPFGLGPDGSVILRGGTETKLGGTGAAVSAGGAIATYIVRTDAGDGSPAVNTLVTRTIATGAEKRVVIPAATVGDDPRLIWISTSGDRVAVAQGYGTGTAQVVARATGRWSAFGAQVTGAFAGQDLLAQTQDQPAKISRNGLYAAITYNAQVSLESLTGTPLLGGGDTLSASSYLSTQGPTCGFGGSPATFDGHLASVPAWLPQPRKGTITITADGAVVKTATSTTPTPYSDPADPAFHVDLPAGTSKVVVKYTAVDQLGRTATESYTKTLTCS